MERTTLNKISKVEFFAVLPAGTYVMLSIYLYFVSVDSNNSTTLWHEFKLLIELTHSQPTALLLLVFCSYLLGSVLRAIPVSYAEKLMDAFRKDVETFPYPDHTKGIISRLNDKSDIANIKTSVNPNLDKEVCKNVYNYWKDVVCIRTPTAFSHYQEFESRTRFFSSMCMAGVVGIIVSGVILFENLHSLHTPAVYLLILSTCVTLAYGLNIKRVRGQEVSTLTGLYIAHIQNKEREIIKPRGYEGRLRIRA